MAVVIKLKYVDELKSGKLRFRRRWPKDVSDKLGENNFQRPMRSRSGPQLAAEHAALLLEYNQAIAGHRRATDTHSDLSHRVRWEEARKEAARLVGKPRSYIEEETIRDVLCDQIEETGGDPMLYKAIRSPDSKLPEPSLQDAFDLYEKEKMHDGQGRNARNRFNRVHNYIKDAIGRPSELPLSTLNRAHGRAIKDHLQSLNPKTGKQLSSETAQRELKALAAIVNHGLREFSLIKTVDNPFMGLSMKSAGEAPTVARESRHPLSQQHIREVRSQLEAKRKRPELLIIWKILEGTGCRPSEVAGLRLQDVFLNHEVPHIQIVWHEGRSIKTESSHRLIPLTGEALEAATQAVTATESQSPMLFAHYGTEGGSDRLSAVINKCIRNVSSDKRHVLYSLRHNFKDRMIEAGIEGRIQDRILGHSAATTGDRVYGSDSSWLMAAKEAMEKLQVR